MDNLLSSKFLPVFIVAAFAILALMFRSKNSGGGTQLVTTGLSSQQAVELASAGIDAQTRRLQITSAKDVALANVAAGTHAVDTAADVQKYTINAEQNVAFAQNQTNLKLGTLGFKTQSDIAHTLANASIEQTKINAATEHYAINKGADVQNRANRYGLFANTFDVANTNAEKGWEAFTNWFNLGNFF